MNDKPTMQIMRILAGLPDEDLLECIKEVVQAGYACLGDPVNIEITQMLPMLSDVDKRRILREIRRSIEHNRLC